MHDLPLITTIAVAFTAAWLLGLLTQRLGLSPIVGYLLAGVAIGPFTPGFVGDVAIAQQLAEVGVILLMFGVGLHFDIKDLLAVKSVAIPGAIGQAATATIVSTILFGLLGMPYSHGCVLGLALAVASTVVLMRVLMDADALHTNSGHVAVGWLLVEDVLTVVVLVLLPNLAPAMEGTEEHRAWPTLFFNLGWSLIKLTCLVALLLIAGSKWIPYILVRVARLRSRELFTLTVLVFSVAIAAGAYSLFGASMALGAFLAGMVVAQSPASHQAAADALPLRDAFAVLFFVSVGMLFDPQVLLREPLLIVTALAIVLIVKPLSALVIVAITGQSARVALTVGIGLAQVGEFSFILSDVAQRVGLLDQQGRNILVAAAIVSITLNPILFRSLPAIEQALRRRPRVWRIINGRAERDATFMNAQHASLTEVDSKPDAAYAVVIGFGPVGRAIHKILTEANLRTCVLDMNLDTITELSDSGQCAIYGDALQESILEHAGVERASHVIVALPHAAARAAVVVAVRHLNESAQILVRAHYLRERLELEAAGANAIVFEEEEVAVALARLVMTRTQALPNPDATQLQAIRHEITESQRASNKSSM